MSAVCCLIDHEPGKNISFRETMGVEIWRANQGKIIIWLFTTTGKTSWCFGDSCIFRLRWLLSFNVEDLGNINLEHFLWNCPQSSQGCNDDKSIMVQLMARCHQATNHYQNQCWSCSMMPYGITRLQWVYTWDLNKMADILQMTFSHRVSSMKSLYLLFEFHWSFFTRLDV